MQSPVLGGDAKYIEGKKTESRPKKTTMRVAGRQRKASKIQS